MKEHKKHENTNNFKYKKGTDGITLIALVITIIVLLILAGVTTATLTGDNGILTRANDAKEQTKEARIEEEIRLAWTSCTIDNYTNTNEDDFYTVENLNKYLNGDGEIINLYKNDNIYTISYSLYNSSDIYLYNIEDNKVIFLGLNLGELAIISKNVNKIGSYVSIDANEDGTKEEYRILYCDDDNKIHLALNGITPNKYTPIQLGYQNTEEGTKKFIFDTSYRYTGKELEETNIPEELKSLNYGKNEIVETFQITMTLNDIQTVLSARGFKEQLSSKAPVNGSPTSDWWNPKDFEAYDTDNLIRAGYYFVAEYYGHPNASYYFWRCAYGIDCANVLNTEAFRPVIILNYDVNIISGKGTVEEPYIID